MPLLKKREFVIFDVETTGLSPTGGDKIVEIAALKIKDLTPIDEFHSLVDPMRDMPFGASQVNGITSDMLVGAPKAREVLPRFLDFIGDAALVGHNVKFDLSFLCYELALLGQGLKSRVVVIDTLKMARGLLPHLGRYPLWLVAESLGVGKEQEHRAASDVQMTFQVFCRLVKEMGDREIEDVGALPDPLEGYRDLIKENQGRLF